MAKCTNSAILIPNGSLPILKMMEARKHPRFPTHLPISFLSEGTNEKGVGIGYDISIGGCAIESETSVQSKSHLQLLIGLPNDGEPIKIEVAVVRWCTPRKFGVEFIGIGPQQKERLKQLVSTLRYGIVMD
jgi:c-di-GMP-binding flagellar brake protein YcgR